MLEVYIAIVVYTEKVGLRTSMKAYTCGFIAEKLQQPDSAIDLCTPATIIINHVNNIIIVLTVQTFFLDICSHPQPYPNMVVQEPHP